MTRKPTSTQTQRSRTARTAAARAADAKVRQRQDSAPGEIGERLRQIYREASRLFVERGYDATSMNDIAEAVNLTKAGVYHFIENKEELLFDIIQLGMDQLFEEVVVPAQLIRDPYDRLRLILRNHIANISRSESPIGNPVTIVVDDPTGLTLRRRRIIDRRKKEYFNLVRDTLRELEADGKLVEGLDTTVAAHTIIGTMLWVARWRRPNGRLTLDQIVEQISRIVLGGVMNEPEAIYIR